MNEVELDSGAFRVKPRALVEGLQQGEPRHSSPIAYPSVFRDSWRENRNDAVARTASVGRK